MENLTDILAAKTMGLAVLQAAWAATPKLRITPTL
jgi:hypothetical protein